MARTYFYSAGFILLMTLKLSGSNLVNAMQEETPRHEYLLQLISHGANPNISIQGCPLIIYVTMKLVRRKTADEQKWHALLETLLKHKAHVDELDTNYYTALMYAAYYGHHDAVLLLLKYHAQADFCNIYGKTPLTIAQEGRGSALTQEQKERYNSIIALLHYAQQA